MKKKTRGVLFLIVILCGLCMTPMRAQTFDQAGMGEDYLLRTEKLEDYVGAED